MAFISPWLLELGIAFDILAFAITLLVALMSYGLYLTFQKPRSLQFSIGVGLMSISYLFFAVINFITYAQETNSFGLGLQDFLPWAMLVRMILMLLGLLILIYLYYEVNGRALQVLFGLLVVLAMVFANASDLAFFVISALFLFFIALKLYDHYRAKPEKAGLFVLVAFVSLFIAKLLSILVGWSGIFLASYLFKLAGVMALLLSLWVISR
jgi:hypothetical protein